ncbi:hypothetical protein BH09ACT7_BH09ACT7_10050 [soil metagenome]
MTQHQIPSALVLGTHVPLTRSAQAECSPSWRARLAATVFAERLDRQLEACVPVRPGTALAVHVARISTSQEREQLARSLRTVLQDARAPRVGGIATRVPVQRTAVIAVEDLIDQVTLRLHAPLPVRARGMARLRLLLSDGVGPVYRTGRGSLAAELRGVLAAL